MNHTISNGVLSAVISEQGAELRSLQMNGIEYMHDGAPTYWGKVAPLVFPICGRLFGGKYTWQGKEYEMELHGFIRYQTLTVSEKSADSITFTFASNEQTRKQYPFDFLFSVTYSLDGNSLKTAFRIVNRSQGELPFSVGGHPGFRMPIGGSGEFTDCYVEFGEPCAAKRIDFSETCFRTGNDTLYDTETLKVIPLRHEMFDRDAIFLYDTASALTLRSRANPHSLRMDFDGFKYVGLWHMPKTDANYICIEPWTGCPSYDGRIDSFETKEDMTHLEQDGELSCAFTLTLG